MKVARQSVLSPTFFILLHLTYLLIFQFDAAHGSKFNPKVKVRTQEVKVDAADSKTAGSSSTVSKSKNKNCAGVNCMPQPVPAPGSPECRPRYDGDSCCPTWICASDELLAKSLFDKDNNWNVKHEYDPNMFDIDEHHEDFEPTAPATASEPQETTDDKKKFERYAAKGKLDNTHNVNFISRAKHQDASASNGRGHNGGPSIANNYAQFKKSVHKNQDIAESEEEDAEFDY